jgi:hypothetical protein
MAARAVIGTVDEIVQAMVDEWPDVLEPVG